MTYSGSVNYILFGMIIILIYYNHTVTAAYNLDQVQTLSEVSGGQGYLKKFIKLIYYFDAFEAPFEAF